MIEIPEALIAAEREAKETFTAAHNAHQRATEAMDEARNRRDTAMRELDDWLAVALGRRAR
jgi:hypothetical protein